MSIRMLFTKYRHVVYVTSLLAEIFVTAHQKKRHPVVSENEALPASRPAGLTDGRTDVPMFIFLLDILHVRKVSNNTKRTQQYPLLLQIKSYFQRL